MNGFSHRYQLGESTFIFSGVRSDFYLLSHFSMKFLCANRIALDGMPQNDVAFCGVTSGAILFAYVPQKGHQAYNELRCTEPRENTRHTHK